jgi:transposase
MKERVTLNKKEQTRLMVLNLVGTARMTAEEAAGLLGLSLRHVRRLLRAYRNEGAQVLAHGNRGRKPANALGDGLKRQVVGLAQSTYAGCNTQHLSELLAEREGIDLSRSSVRRILLEAGIRSPRKRRPPKHRSRRERYPEEGMLLQIDGSRDDWLEVNRLKSELRIAGARTTKEASHVLWDFLPRFNQRFAVPAREPGSTYQQTPGDFKPDEIFCFKYERTVGKDNVVRCGEHRLQINPTNGRSSMDGSLGVYYQGQCLLVTEAPPEAPVLRARNIERVMPDRTKHGEAKILTPEAKPQPKTPWKPGPDHPWRRSFRL